MESDSKRKKGNIKYEIENFKETKILLPDNVKVLLEEGLQKGCKNDQIKIIQEFVDILFSSFILYRFVSDYS